MTPNTEISIRYVELDQVAGWPRNPKQHDFETLIDSLRRFGFTQPLVKDETSGRLVAGHGRLEGLIRMKAAGAPPPARIVVTQSGAWSVPVLQGISFKSDQEAEAYLIADNRVSELGGWNEEDLTAILQDLDDLCGVGFEFKDEKFEFHDPTTDQEEEDEDLPAAASSRPIAPRLPTPNTSAPATTYNDPVFGKLSPEIVRSKTGLVLGNVKHLAPAPSAHLSAPPQRGGQPGAGSGTGTVPWKAVTQPNSPSYGPETLKASYDAALQGDEEEETTSDLSSVVGDFVAGHSTGLPIVRFRRHRIPISTVEDDALEAALIAYIENNGSMHGFVSHLLENLPPDAVESAPAATTATDEDPATAQQSSDNLGTNNVHT